MKYGFALLLTLIFALEAPMHAPVTRAHAEEDSVISDANFFPSEESKHEGTWLIWPHHHTYGRAYRQEIEPVWLEMVRALHTGERVHIIAYDPKEQRRIAQLLEAEGVDMAQVDFVIAKSDDVWARDTGPIFVFDRDQKLAIADFAFDGWGKKVPYANDDRIPRAVAAATGLPIIDIPGLVVEGGAIELDGAGTLMACKSSILSKNRNAGIAEREAEKILAKYLGVTHFIWLEGAMDQDITDAHIDGSARFFQDHTILTVSEDDFFELYDDLPESDYAALRNAKNAKGQRYRLVELPMTAQNVEGMDIKGSYLNFFVGNEVVLLPVYRDANDQKAIDILAQLYQGRKIVPIDVTSLYPYGGMIHCVTQQQPEA